MGIKVAINYRTSHTYDRLVTLSPHIIRLRRAPHCRTPVVSYAIRAQQNLNGVRVAVASGRDAADVAIYSQFGDPVELLQMVDDVVRLPGPPW